MSAVGAILAKELRVEFRSWQSVSSYLLLAVLVLAAFRFAFEAFNVEDTELAAPILWVTVFFAGMFSLSPLYRREVDGATKEGLLLAPVPGSSVYFGKLLASLVVVFGMELFILVVFFVFFPYDLPDIAALASVMVLGTLGFVALGNIISAISSSMSQAAVMLPVLLIPLLLFTVVVATISATAEVFSGGGLGDVTEELRFLAAFALVFVATGYLSTDLILEA